MQLQSVKETAERFNLSERRVQKLCEAGRIKGAKMISNVWLIPNTAKKPMDKRFSAEINEMMSLSDLCKELSISVATGRNWVKLGKLVPTTENKKTLYFSYDYITKIKSDLQTGNNTALKSRRNKKYVFGNNIYNSYVSEKSSNLPSIEFILDTIEAKHVKITDDLLLSIIADCAVQLILSRTNSTQLHGNIFDYLEGAYHDHSYMFLVDDLLSKNACIMPTIQNYSELFNVHYVYEKHEDVLGLLYISLKNIERRKATGSYYTPTKVVKKLCNRLFVTNEHLNKTILDPCCGTGNFILQLPSSIQYTHVFGNDIDPISVKIARINYALKYLLNDKNTIYNHITEQDYLTFSEKLKFDFIIGNPPWGYIFSETQKNILRHKYSSAVGSSIESYDVFIEQAFRNLNVGGVLSFVLPEAVLNVKSHIQVRTLMLETNSFQYLELLGNAFDNVQCPCIILQMLHTGKPFETQGLIVNDGKREFTIQKNRPIHAEYLSFDTTDDEFLILNKINTISNKITLAGNAIFALGIVTGNNKKYISTRKYPDNEMILKGSDLCKFKFNDANNYIAFKPKEFQQTAPTEYYRADEKLLYRFICSQLVFAYDNRHTLSLNSCNIVIPQIEGLSIKYIMAIFNSRIMQFYFKKQFNSVKVLRSHIEQLPIPYIGKTAQEDIIAIVDSILKTSDKKQIINLYENLDIKVSKLYGLSQDEYTLIQTSQKGENLFL